jgi:hypothetical protein
LMPPQDGRMENLALKFGAWRHLRFCFLSV